MDEFNIMELVDETEKMTAPMMKSCLYRLFAQPKSQDIEIDMYNVHQGTISF